MKAFDIGNAVVIAVTFILFAIALFTTGFTKDLLLETGVFLVSIKLIMMNRAASRANREILKKLDEIEQRLP